MLTFSEIALSFKNQVTDEKANAKVWEYLIKRGINRQTAEAAGLHIMPAIELIAAARRSPNIKGADNRMAVVFPHWRLGQSEPIEWWSSRLVESADKPAVRLVASFGDYIDPTAPVGHRHKPGKMFCPPNEPPHAYLVPDAILPWNTLKREDRVYIHESCIKALNSAVLGFHSVGLNGVQGWRSRKHDIALVEELRDLPWKALHLQPVIVFDSNTIDNWQVQEARTALAAKLYEVTGRHAVGLTPPKYEGEDQGFDDFRVRVGDEAAYKFLDEGPFEDIEISELQRMMIELSSQVCVVRELGRIADQATGDLMSRQVFTDVNYAHYVAEIEDGDDARNVNVPKLWLANPRRVEAQSLEYSPGMGRLVPSKYGIPNLNLWHGMGCEPEPGDVEPWLELLVNNIHDEDLRQWIIAWFAYPLQNPGSKLNSYLLIFGPSGMGKDRFIKPFHSIYGKNSVTIGKDTIKSSFTSLYSMRQFVQIDELARAKGDEDTVSQKVKALTTQEMVVVNRKGQPEYEIRNHANLVITSNYVDCIKLDQDDRRACVLKWMNSLDRRGDQRYWMAYSKWADTVGPGALYAWLLEKDISWFDPTAWAMATPWKEIVKEAAMAPGVSVGYDPSGTLFADLSCFRSYGYANLSHYG